MKNLFSLTLLLLLVLSCNKKTTTETEEATKDTVVTSVAVDTMDTSKSAELLSCSMHPEIIGKKGDNCSKCGMNLTEPVK